MMYRRAFVCLLFAAEPVYAQHYADEGLVIHMADSDFKVAGGMTKEDALRGCEGFIPSFKNVSFDLHKTQPDLKAKIVIEFVIGQSGKILKSKIKNSNLKDTTVYADALTETLKEKHVEFPALLKGKQALVVCGFTAHAVPPGDLDLPKDEHLLEYPGQ